MVPLPKTPADTAVARPAAVGYGCARDGSRRGSHRLRWIVSGVCMLALLWLGLWAIWPRFDGPGESARAVATRAVVWKMLPSALDLYRQHMGHYPSDAEGGLAALLTRPPGPDAAGRWAGPYLADPRNAEDAWGHQVLYRCPGRHNPDSYDLQSFGPDGVANTGDDITNWTQ